MSIATGLLKYPEKRERKKGKDSEDCYLTLWNTFRLTECI